jgi:hypothetical protein
MCTSPFHHAPSSLEQRRVRGGCIQARSADHVLPRALTIRYLYETDVPVTSLVLQPEEVTGTPATRWLASEPSRGQSPPSCAQQVPHQRVSNHHLVHHAADAKWVRWDDFEAQLDSGDDSLVAVEKGEYAPLFALLRERYPPLGDS